MENKVLARVGNQELTQKDLDFMKNTMDPNIAVQFQGDQGQYYLLQELINQKLMTMEYAEKYKEEPEFLYEYERMKENFVNQYAINKLISSVEVSDEEVEKFYKENEKEFSESEVVKASHILLEDEEVAKKIKSDLDDGADFEELAKEYSICPSKDRGGDLGFFGKGQMVKEFEDVAFSMQIGKISEPIKTQFGYHIIRLDDKKMQPKQEFAKIKDSLRHSLIKRNQQKVYIDKINELREKYGVK